MKEENIVAITESNKNGKSKSLDTSTDCIDLMSEFLEK